MTTDPTKASGDEAEKWADGIIGDCESLATEYRAMPRARLHSDIKADLISLHRRATRAEQRVADLEAELAKAVALPEMTRGSAVLVTRAKCNGLYVAEWFGDANIVCSDHMTTGDSAAAALSALREKMKGDEDAAR